jgi:GTP-binding protein
MFVDTARIHVIGGRGGNGCCSFRREKYVPLGGPDGGDGGDGGSVILVADNDVDSLNAFVFAPRLKAPKGGNGKGKDMTGPRGSDKIAKVPVGTLIREAGTEEALADLTRPGQEFIAARGGKGGRGNAAFKTNTNRAPREFEEGKPGEERDLDLELKLIADVGLVGFPNAGKSSLISKVCNVRPKVASYPFTTLGPNLGVLIIDEVDKIIKLADMPGLIEGAHEGRGLGHQFLRHIERTKVLLFVLDTAGVDGRSPLEDFVVLREELEQHDPELMGKPFLIACNKMDLPGSAENLMLFVQESGVKKQLIFPISCITSEGVEAMVEAISDLHDSLDGKAD